MSRCCTTSLPQMCHLKSRPHIPVSSTVQPNSDATVTFLIRWKYFRHTPSGFNVSYLTPPMCEMLLGGEIRDKSTILVICALLQMYTGNNPVYPNYNPASLGLASASFCTQQEFSLYSAAGHALLLHMATAAVCKHDWADLAWALRQYPAGFPMRDLHSCARFCPEYTRGIPDFPGSLLREPRLEVFMRRLVSIVGGSGPYAERQAVARMLFVIGPRIPALEGHIGYFAEVRQHVRYACALKFI